MSQELKTKLHLVAEADKIREEKEFAEGFERYKSLLIRVAKVRPFDMLPQSEGPEFYNVHQVMHDLAVLERANLLVGTLKETGRSEYYQYDLSPEGEQLVLELSKEA
ncbi:MAG: hypothetical protein NWE92_03440 [Candidatus Bathyarchaeota archaeon]|nr:hypothetical protein [Candidatus Bathyarchaeota archaeon]